MISKKYIISVIAFSLILLQSSKAMNLVLYAEKPYKQKLQLIINGKKVQKKVKFFDEVIYAVGSKGFVKGGAEWGVGGYCHKFQKREAFYKKVKIFDAISVIKNYEKCLNKIETYNNAKDDNLNEYFMYTNLYLSEKVFLDTGGLISWEGMENYTDKITYIIEYSQNNTKAITFIPYKKFDENNSSAKNFVKFIYSLEKKMENSELSESQLSKQLLSKMASLSLIEYNSAIKIVLNTENSNLANLIKNQDYLYSCQDLSSSTAGSFNKSTLGFIGDNVGYESMNSIRQSFNNTKTSKGFDFERFRYDKTLSKKNFADLLSEPFNHCISEGLFDKILVQSRN